MPAEAGLPVHHAAASGNPARRQDSGGNACETAGWIWFDAMLQLSRTSQFKDIASIPTQTDGGTNSFGKDAKKTVRDAWKKVGPYATKLI